MARGIRNNPKQPTARLQKNNDEEEPSQRTNRR